MSRLLAIWKNGESVAKIGMIRGARNNARAVSVTDLTRAPVAKLPVLVSMGRR